MRNILRIGAVGIVVLLVSCDTGEAVRANNGNYNYIPTKYNWYQVYNVEEVKYTLGIPETLTYELKTVVADSFLNGSGKYTYLVYRSVRSVGETEWKSLNTWTIRLEKNEVVIQEENIPFVALQLPVVDGNRWNGNKYNNLINRSTNTAEDYYNVEEKGMPFAVNDQTFANCVIVNQEDNQEYVVYLDQRKEVYANNVGLIYKARTQLSFCTESACIGQQKVEEGIIYKQSITSYGVE